MPGPFHVEGPNADGSYFLSSLDAKVNGKYLILSNSRHALETVRARLASGELPEPHVDASSYRLVRVSGQTPIYEMLSA